MVETKIIGSGKWKYLIVCSLHGNELTPALLSHKLPDHLNNFLKNDFKEVTIINYANNYGIKNRCRENLEIVTDMNRLFNDNITSNDVVDHIRTIIHDYDIVIDVHSSANLVSPCFIVSKNEYADSIIEHLKGANLKWAQCESSTDTLKKYAISKGKLGFTFEVDGLNYCKFYQAEEAIFDISKLIRHFNTQDKIVILAKEPTYPCMEFYKHDKSGIVYWHDLANPFQRRLAMLDIETDIYENIKMLGDPIQINVDGYFNHTDDLSLYTYQIRDKD